MKRRSKKGFSIILVITLGFISVLMALAVTSSLIPVYKDMGAQNTANVAEASAEAGLQYAIAKLNREAANNNLATVTSPIAIPSAVAGPSTVTVTMSMLNPAPATLVSSPIYNQTAVNFGATDYRTLVSTATYGLNSYTIRTVLAPSLFTKTQSPTTPFFSGTLFGNHSVQLNGSVSVRSENGNNKVTVGSNRQISLLGTNLIDGSVNAYGTDSTVPSIIGTTGSFGRPNTTINGNLNYNGNMSNASGKSAAPFRSDIFASLDSNVLGDGIRGPLPTAGQISRVSSSTQATVAPVQAQTNSQAAVMTAAGTNTTYVTEPALGQTVDLGVINLSGNNVLVLPAGNYTATSITLSGNAQINTVAAQNSNAQPGVNITLQNNMDSGTALSIGGKGITTRNNSPTNLQFFYDGTGNVSIDMTSSSNLYALVYAPNAPVSLNTANSGNFHGALSAMDLSVSGNGQVSYDPSYTNGTGGSASVAAGPKYTKASTTQSFNVVSWQEPTRAQYP